MQFVEGWAAELHILRSICRYRNEREYQQKLKETLERLNKVNLGKWKSKGLCQFFSLNFWLLGTFENSYWCLAAFYLNLFKASVSAEWKVPHEHSQKEGMGKDPAKWERKKELFIAIFSSISSFKVSSTQEISRTPCLYIYIYIYICFVLAVNLSEPANLSVVGWGKDRHRKGWYHPHSMALHPCSVHGKGERSIAVQSP